MPIPIEHAPPVALPERRDWTRQLTRIAREPLEYCPQFPTIAKRFEAWWNQELLDRPILIAAANGDPSRPITRRLDLLEDPDEWFCAKVRDLNQQHRVGDALPHVRVDFGPVLLGPMFGGELEFGANTAWTHAFIDDQWTNEPDWVLFEENRWWKLLRELTDRVASEAAGKYLVCTPDLGASADVLLNLRGASPLCMDTIQQPERIERAVEAMYPASRAASAELYRIALGRGAGLIHWLGPWSNEPYLVPACDFNYMIAPRTFNDLFLGDIARQTATFGRGVFHLDGPGAANHIDALLEVPYLEAIQFTPGEGSPSALQWVEMFRKIQERGRSLLIISPADEILALCDALRPEGLAFLLDAPPPPDELDGLYDELKSRFGCDESTRKGNG